MTNVLDSQNALNEGKGKAISMYWALDNHSGTECYWTDNSLFIKSDAPLDDDEESQPYLGDVKEKKRARDSLPISIASTSVSDMEEALLPHRKKLKSQCLVQIEMFEMLTRLK